MQERVDRRDSNAASTRASAVRGARVATSRLRMLCGATLLAISPLLPGAGQHAGVSFYDFSTTPWTDMRAGFRLKTVVGERGSFVIGEMGPGVRTTLHHHTHEQINFGLAGSVAVTVGETRHPLTKLGVTFAPSEAAHFAANDGGETATFGEFQPVRRFDLVPPRERLTFPAAPKPIEVPNNLRMFVDFNPSSSGWHTTNQDVGVKELIGVKCGVRVLRLPDRSRGAISMALSTDVESFIYVAQGAAEIEIAGQRHKLSPETLLVVSESAGETHLRKVADQPAVVMVFTAR